MNESAGPLDVGAAVIRLTTAVGERVLEVRAASGLSAIQLQVLRIAANGVGMSSLAQLLGAPKSTVTSVVDQLEAMQLAERASDQDDRRRQIVRASATGEARLREFDLALAGRIDALLKNLSPDRVRRLRELMHKLPDATAPIPLTGPR
jgi:DNA-binding MarR family transcriptional regulator